MSCRQPGPRCRCCARGRFNSNASGRAIGADDIFHRIGRAVSTLQCTSCVDVQGWRIPSVLLALIATSVFRETFSLTNIAGLHERYTGATRPTACACNNAVSSGRMGKAKNEERLE